MEYFDDILLHISNVINEKQYELSFINPKKTNFEQDADHKTETYIIQLLKTALIHIYLEYKGYPATGLFRCEKRINQQLQSFQTISQDQYPKYQNEN